MKKNSFVWFTIFILFPLLPALSTEGDKEERELGLPPAPLERAAFPLTSEQRQSLDWERSKQLLAQKFSFSCARVIGPCLEKERCASYLRHISPELMRRQEDFSKHLTQASLQAAANEHFNWILKLALDLYCQENALS